MASGLPPNEWSMREHEDPAVPFHEFVSKATHFHFHFIPFESGKSPTAASLAERRISLHLWKGGISENLWTYF